jgi:hypothetical protein
MLIAGIHERHPIGGNLLVVFIRFVTLAPYSDVNKYMRLYGSVV